MLTAHCAGRRKINMEMKLFNGLQNYFGISVLNDNAPTDNSMSYTQKLWMS